MPVRHSYPALPSIMRQYAYPILPSVILRFLKLQLVVLFTGFAIVRRYNMPSML